MVGQMKIIEFIDDCVILQGIAHKLGFAPTLYQIEKIWSDISEQNQAGWLCIQTYLDNKLEGELNSLSIGIYGGDTWFLKVLIEGLEKE